MRPFDNGWLKIGNIGKVKAGRVGVQFKYKRKVKEAYMPEAEIEKNVWIVKATPAVLEKCIRGRIWNFGMPQGRPVWTNKKDVPYIAFSGKCPHLGCGI